MKKNISQYQRRIPCKWKPKTFSFGPSPVMNDQHVTPRNWHLAHQIPSPVTRHWRDDFLQGLSHLSLAIANRSSSSSSSKRLVFFMALTSWGVGSGPLCPPLDLSAVELVCESVICHWSLKGKTHVKVLWQLRLRNLKNKIQFPLVKLSRM